MKTKNIVCLMLILFFAVSLPAGTYDGGSGTELDPYQIAKTADLIELSNTSGDWSAYFIQTADIAFNADETQVDWNNDGSSGPAEGFSPIGNISTEFTGEYDGGGYSIDNLYINLSATNIALFSKTDGATITNICVTNVDITGNYSVGGLVGSNNNSTVSNSYSTGSVSGGGNNAGGLVGYNNNSTVSNSYSTCSVSTDYYGIDQYAGGLVGTNIDNSTISNSYSTGSVSGSSDVGGLVGYNLLATISNSYSTGSVNGSPSGGLVGSNDGTVNDSFWDTETSGQSTSSGGTALTTAEMKTQSTFTNAGWDFSTPVWKIADTVIYPFLAWQPSANIVIVNSENGVDGEYPVGTVLHLSAYVYPPGSNMAFVNWTDNNETILSEEMEFDYTVTEQDVTLTANYEHGLGFSVLTVSNDGVNVILDWDNVPGAAYYQVFSGSDPYGTFTLDTSGDFEGTTWTAPFNGNKRFYYIVAYDGN